MTKLTKFTDIAQDTPRLVIMFRQDGNEERFQWGIVGKVPVLTLVGCIARIQTELPLIEPGDARHDCPESALVVAWDENSPKFVWFVNPIIPVDSLVGMMEMVKATLVDTHIARQVAAQQLILGPDGQPARR